MRLLALFIGLTMTVAPPAPLQIIGSIPSEGLQPAVRVNPPSPPPPVVVPEQWPPPDLCVDASMRRVQAGLPSAFDGLAYRESRCRNDVRTYCCYGLYQIYWSVVSQDHRMQVPLFWCGVDSLDDIYGESPRQRDGNTCVAKAMFDVVGYQPWAQ